MILSYKVDGPVLRVVTDNPGRPEFAYPVDKFNNLEALEVEIEKSIALEAKRKEVRDTKFLRLTDDFSKASVTNETVVAVPEPE